MDASAAEARAVEICVMGGAERVYGLLTVFSCVLCAVQIVQLVGLSAFVYVFCVVLFLLFKCSFLLFFVSLQLEY